MNIKQESDIIQVDYERLKSQSKQDGDSQHEFQESIKALELVNKHLKESLSLFQEEHGKMLSTHSVELNEIRELNSEENLKLQKNIQMLTEEKEVNYIKQREELIGGFALVQSAVSGFTSVLEFITAVQYSNMITSSPTSHVSQS